MKTEARPAPLRGIAPRAVALRGRPGDRESRPEQWEIMAAALRETIARHGPISQAFVDSAVRRILVLLGYDQHADQLHRLNIDLETLEFSLRLLQHVHGDVIRGRYAEVRQAVLDRATELQKALKAKDAQIDTLYRQLDTAIEDAVKARERALQEIGRDPTQETAKELRAQVAHYRRLYEAAELDLAHRELMAAVAVDVGARPSAPSEPPPDIQALGEARERDKRRYRETIAAREREALTWKRLAGDLMRLDDDGGGMRWWPLDARHLDGE